MHVTLKNVTKKFGKTLALNNVSLTIDDGGIISVLGLNGAGKTTLLRALSGLLTPNGGSIEYDDKEFKPNVIDLKRRLMFLPDFPPLYPEMTPIQHIGMVFNVYELSTEGIEDKLMTLLDELNMLKLANSRITTFSRGETYKTALATLLLINPDLFLLDEPFASGMDPLAIAVMKKHLSEAAKNGRTILYSTQILEVNENFADKIIVLDKGEVAAYDTLKNLQAPLTAPKNDLIRRLFKMRGN